MRFFILLLLFFLLNFESSAQENTAIEDFLNEANSIVYSQPEKAQKLADYIISSSKNESQIAEGKLVLATSFYIQGNYENALSKGLEATEYKDKVTSKTKIKLNVLLANIFQDIGLDAVANLYIEEAEKLGTVEDLLFEDWRKYAIYQLNGSENYNNDSIVNAFEFYYEAKNINISDSLKVASQYANLDIEIANLHLRNFQLDSATIYFENAGLLINKYENTDYLKMLFLLGKGNIYFLNKQYKKSIETLNEANRIAIFFNNLKYQIKFNELIASNYLALDDLENFKLYTNKNIVLSLQKSQSEQNAVNIAYNYINNQEEIEIKNSADGLNQTVIILVSILIILIFVFFILKFYYTSKVKTLKGFISYFQKREKPALEKIEIQSETAKSLSIPKETENTIIKKLFEFENSERFLNKEMSLAQLASQFETNTKYLSEIINVQKDKNFNAYVNELRINYITDKLKTDSTYLNYKISYLAEETGFSSHSIFTTVFKSVTGISPSIFIKIINSQKEMQKVS